MKKMLFIISGLGLGNSTRCHAVISHLHASGFQVDVATSGNGLTYFSEINAVDHLIPLQGLRYGNSKGGLSIWKTLGRLPWLFLQYFSNSYCLWKILKKENYSAIVIDSEYSLAPLLFFIKKPLFAFNSAALTVQTFKKMNVKNKSLYFSFFIERLDAIFHQLFPRWVLCPSLESGDDGQVHVSFPPFLRPKIQNKTLPLVPLKVVVMVSGSEIQSALNFLDSVDHFSDLKFEVIGRSGACKNNLFFHGKITANEEILSTADILIVNGGLGAVSEAVAIGVPTLVLPIHNHAEQYVNAKLMEEKGWGLLVDEDTVMQKLTYLKQNYSVYSKNHQQSKMDLNGASLAAQFIESQLR